MYMFNRKSRFYCNPICGSLVLCYAMVTNNMDFLLHVSDYLLILSNSALLLGLLKERQRSEGLYHRIFHCSFMPYKTPSGSSVSNVKLGKMPKENLHLTYSTV